MNRSSIMDGAARMLAVGVLLAVTAGFAFAAAESEKLVIPVGHAHVVVADEAVKTVAIAEPKTADAAVGSERTVIVNAKAVGSTSLVVYGDAGRFRVYEVEVFEPNAERQVALHVRVAEVNDRAKKELGFDLTGQGRPNTPGHSDFISGGLFTTKVESPSIPLGTGPTTDGKFTYTRDYPNLLLDATWRALQETGDVKVLANPTLVAKSGEKAKFLAGGEFPVPIASSTGSNAVTVTIDWKEFGVQVEFTPTVQKDGSLVLEVAPEVSRLDYTNPLVLSGYVVPVVDTRKTSTTVRLNPGEHLVIGGLKQTERTKVLRKVPVLGDIPLLNFFFSTTRTETLDRELMVVVSPEMLDVAAGALPRLPTDGMMDRK